jgi:hypothetical protein
LIHAVVAAEPDAARGQGADARVDVGDLPPGDREGLRAKIGHGRDADLGPVRVDDQGERALI